MIISLIAAVSENNVIGKNNDLPWHLPADLKFFREKTMGHCVVMGRKNYESIPDKFRPLPGRTNIVITRQTDLQIPSVVVVHSLKEALQEARNRKETECFITGGGEIFSQSIYQCDRIYLTRIHHHFDGDIFFPELKEEDWTEISRTRRPADKKNRYSFSFLTLERKKNPGG